MVEYSLKVLFELPHIAEYTIYKIFNDLSYIKLL